MTHCGLVMPYGDRDRGNIGSGNGLLPDGTKPLPEPMLTYHQWSFVVFTLQQFTQEAHEISVHDMSLKISQGPMS